MVALYLGNTGLHIEGARDSARSVASIEQKIAGDVGNNE